MVIVHTIVIVRDRLGLTQSDVALTPAAYGAGSILGVLTLPRLLDRIADRTIMLSAGTAMASLLALLAFATFWYGTAPGFWLVILGGWFLLGIAYAMSITPSGRLLKRSATASDRRPALFAAQFALSHCCWRLCYPLVGQLGANVGQGVAL